MSSVVEYFEIVMRPCQHNYGVSPCTATGDRPCYNSPRTCQDVAHFSATNQIVRWAIGSGELPIDIPAIPSMTNMQTRAQELKAGESLGVRESLSVTFHDHAYNDELFDKYRDTRGFNPYNKGGFWRKFAVRWPNLKGLECRSVRGSPGQSIDEMERHYYVIDSTGGPNNDGGYSITAKDAITFLDGDKAQAPVASLGVLSGNITDTGTSFNLSPSGIGNANYPAAGLASIGDELVRYTRSGNTITLTARELFGSKRGEHKAGETFQVAIEFVSQEISQIIYNLLGNYTDTPINYLDFASWSSETTAHLSLLYSGRIAKPTSVKKLIDEIIEQAGLMIWTDTAEKKIKVKVLRNEVPTLNLNDDNFLKKSFTGSTDFDSQKSNILFFYGQKNPLEKVDDEKNYGAILNDYSQDAALSLEGAPLAVHKIYSRWVELTNATAANYLSSLMLGRYGRAPRICAFNLPKSLTPKLGSTVNIQSERFLDDQGDTAPPAPFLITKVEPREADYSVQAQEIHLPKYDDSGTRYVYIDGSTNNIDLKTLHDSIYLPATSGTNIIFKLITNVFIGSTEITTFAVTHDGWAAGVTVSIDFGGGVIQGRGGWPGSAWTTHMGGGGYSPSPGGPALKARQPLTLINAKVWSGGGGGGPGTVLADYSSSGGGGGAGTVCSVGASATYGGNGTYSGSATPGGSGGGPGLPGAAGAGGGFGAPAGVAIDGIGFVTFSGTSDIRGPQI
ncbi:MAG TPA: hypothetical protein VIZ65_01195 [Cellvibrionaceae bacterium]